MAIIMFAQSNLSAHPTVNMGSLVLIFTTCITIHTNSISFVLQGTIVKHTLTPIFVFRYLIYISHVVNIWSWSNPNIAPPDIAPPSFSVNESYYTYFNLPPPSIYCHKLRWTNCGAISWYDCRLTYALVLIKYETPH